MLALAYLEWRYAFNNARAIVRTPLRLLVWAPYLFFVLYFGYARLVRAHGSGPTLDVLPTYAVTIAGSYLALLGSTIALAAGGRITAFRSPGEAILLSNAGVRPLTIALWLQLRKIAASPMRWLGGFFYLFAIAAPRNAGAIALVRSLVVVGLVVSLAMGMELPMFLLARGPLRTPLRVLGWAIAAIGAAYAIVGIAGPRAFAMVEGYVHVDPGNAVHVLLAGDPTALAILAMAVALLVTSIGLLGDDALPELYAASQGSLAVRLRRQRAASTPYELARSPRETRIPAGSLALVWKDWVGFRRGRGMLRIWLFGCVASIAAGAATGFARTYFGDPAPIFTLVGGAAALVSVLAPFGATVGLASDLAKPLFWLGASPLRQRIAAWTIARAWRGGLLFGLAPATAGIMTGEPVLALLSIPLSIVAYWSLQSLGVGLYAIFPNPIDARGPMLLLRLLITSIYVAPAILLFGIVSIVTNQDALAALVAGVLFVLQGYGVVELSSYRFREYGASLSTMSKAT